MAGLSIGVLSQSVKTVLASFQAGVQVKSPLACAGAACSEAAISQASGMRMRKFMR
ncbi:MAG: hypothetical protein WDM85_17975 [Caulobacteraceae bacterium]